MLYERYSLMWNWIILCSQVGDIKVMSKLLCCQTTHFLLQGVILIIKATGVFETLVP